MKLDWSRFDGARAKARAALEKLPGKAGELARKANEALGRPLADEAELADRRAFATGSPAPASAAASDAGPPAGAGVPAPVVVFHMDKSRRDALKLTEILDVSGVPYLLSNIQEDPAAQMAVRRDSGEHRLPVVFIAGEVIGGRSELLSLQQSGELKKKVWG